MDHWIELTDGIAHKGIQPASILLSSKGYDFYEHALAVTNAVDYLEWMEEKGRVDSEIAKNLKTMLTSEDRDNFNIAILAIEELKK